MLNKIISFSIKNKLIIGLFILLLVAWGSYSLKKLPIDAVPDITNNQVQIITNASSQAAADIERLVTFPIEQSIATIPGITEVRSFSRFGLSVITIVFEEDIDIYWARQQVTERLSDVKNSENVTIGRSWLAPVTTGLGEIYQYVLHPKKGYEDEYTATDLRTMQDWIVRRQLLGVDGVADISSFGGYLKQYEVAVNPDKLRSMGVSVSEVIAALENNNRNTGGAYIDSKPNAYFIRTEGFVESYDEIEQIVVKVNNNGIPIQIRDIGKVQEGHAVRYGALTYNTEGEAVGGIVMMLKGANSSEVIANVKDRVEQIKKTLPEGIVIEPFLDRTKLVNNAIGTVSKNLIEGALIVIFVLVLLLGNFRAGLVVASVIPLSMLFAFSMMNLFGVSGNLMSLGAIDFGLIVDGAVIIVEATMHHLSKAARGKRLSRKEMDEEVFKAAGRIRTSAAFGEIIILIVYLPILALTGIEGKMFGPMAQTVSFAIAGAFILSLTYVPMMSALFLSRESNTKQTFSDKLIARIQSWYTPLLEKALNYKRSVVLVAFGLFGGALLLFNAMGAEFLPSLDEGDFAVEVRLMAGTSLRETVDITSKASEILLKEYPDEIKEVVGKIGSSEIPTDPMPIEACDLMVILNDKDEWTKADKKDELANKMSQSLEKLAGVVISFQQPIQMRFNELMTGAKQDVVVKVYGEDLDLLTNYAREVAGITADIEGAKDIYEEQVTGLTQIVIDYDREALARHGLNIDEINKTVNAAFAGYNAGQVYEQERRFDLVVRLEGDVRDQIDDVRDLIITTDDGRVIPLTQLADISYKSGPNQIQRDDAKRRIVIGFNVRGRDVESVVNELEKKINKQVAFAPGYYVTYGGTFENLQQARSRLLVAVPIALLLIFILLYFTFGSIKQGLMIYTAIPLSAIGGVLALLLRGMPFSISAAIGFIALFGVAVLNGIVLIAEFNRLKAKGTMDTNDIIMKGTKTRLRPVIMTALVASLGFLPMALSQSSGAEVQKPLATVVIGGLITATLLTLFVLPCLYYIAEKLGRKSAVIKRTTVVLMLLFIRTQSNAQQLTLDDAINIAVKNNYGLRASTSEIEYHRQMKRAAFELPKTQVNAQYGQYNSRVTDDNSYAFSQQIPFPSLMFAKSSLANKQIESAILQKDVTKNELVYNVKQVYYELKYLDATQQLLIKLDSLYADFANAASVRYRTGESTLLEQSTATAKSIEIHNRLIQNTADISIAYRKLQVLLSTEETIHIDGDPLNPLSFSIADESDVDKNPVLKKMQKDIAVINKQKSVALNGALPDMSIGYFTQTMIGIPLSDATNSSLATSTDRFTGVQVGISIPLWIGPHIAKIKAEGARKESAEMRYQSGKILLDGMFEQSKQEFIKQKTSLDYYEKTGLKNAELIATQSLKAYRAGEISYTEYLINLQQVQDIKQQYLKTVNGYNQAVLKLQYLSGSNL
ncbi:MAG: CusA/CzcA family heavy metal efflux RND transporter [Chitinophagaceae bacterium]|nr:CusA/CzcA family heavy metal efflux RND transporter [Chitinophagaceae bacterium]